MPSGLLLLGCGKRSSGVAPLVSTFQTSAADSADLITYTFASQAIGTATATRRILVPVTTRFTATVSSVTIGGVSATSVQSHANNINKIHWWIATVPTGTTANIVVTWSTTVARCGIGVWSLEGLLSTTPTAVATDTTLTGNDLSTTINVSAGGGCFAVALDAQQISTKAFTFAGVTERYDADLDPATRHSGANLDFAVAQTGMTVTATENATTATVEPLLSVIALR